MTTFNITGKELFDRMAAGEMFSVKLADDESSSIMTITDAEYDGSGEVSYKYTFSFAATDVVLIAADDNSKVEFGPDPGHD